MSTTLSHCPNCHAPLQDGDRFCEQCGEPIAVQAPVGADDRIELDLGVAAAVSDRGKVHRRNEDSFHVEVVDERGVVVVVCDGTSSASAGNAAARDAAKTAGAVLGDALAQPDADATAAMTEAIQAAGGAVQEVEWTTRTGRVNPSCTLVSALRRGDEVVIGWVGDSRAYWIDGVQTRQLTVDDSLGQEGIEKGMLTPEQAAASPVFHAITHWVGPDSPARPPRLASLTPERPGRLLLCTDGLWNYLPTIPELTELIATLPDDASPLSVARALTDVALAKGGDDNITVAVIDVR
ncbi:MAG TPA: PP2C family serine/threonine-protein phosphatase [Solirubrobacteraceae bacterium]|nr:PP2C family serine/threonine-protein phosphatase [Solirubrobacteraceae bacterium]